MKSIILLPEDGNDEAKVMYFRVSKVVYVLNKVPSHFTSNYILFNSTFGQVLVTEGSSLRNRSGPTYRSLSKSSSRGMCVPCERRWTA